MASRYGLEGIIKRSLDECSQSNSRENSLEKGKGGRKGHKVKLRGGLRSQGNNKMEEGYSRETSSWSCKKCINTFMTVQGFYRHAKRNKNDNLVWSCVKCNDTEAFPTVCRALAHFSTAAATGATELESHKSFRCIMCQHVCDGKKELLTHDCSKPGGTIGRPRQAKNIKKEPGLEDYSDEDDFGDSRQINDDDDDDEDYKPDLGEQFPNAFLNLSNDDIDKELGHELASGSQSSQQLGTSQYMNSMKPKQTGHHKHKRKGRQPKDPNVPKEKKKSTWAAINEKNYLCNLCGKTLKGLTAYKRHQVVHTGARPYECDVCGKTFTQNQRLTVHHRMHTGERPYLCSLCGKTFTESCKLKRHLTRVHKAETGGSKIIAGSMMGTQPLPPHQQPGGGGPLGLRKQQDYLAQVAGQPNVGLEGADGNELEMKHQPGNMLLPSQSTSHGHAPAGHNQQSQLHLTQQQGHQGNPNSVNPHQQQAAVAAAAMAQQQQAAAAVAAAAAEHAQLSGGMATAGPDATSYAAAAMAAAQAHAAQVAQAHAAQVAQKRVVGGNYNQHHGGGGGGNHQGRPPGSGGGGQGNKKMQLNV